MKKEIIECDVCHNNIKDGEAAATDEFYLGDDYHDVCLDCYTKIVVFIKEIRKKKKLEMKEKNKWLR